MMYYETLRLIKRLKSLATLSADQATLLAECEAEVKQHREYAKSTISERRKKFSEDRKISIARRDVAHKTTKRHELKKRAVEYKGSMCAHCKGSFHIAVFEFHHIDIDNKEFTIAKAGYGNWEKVRLELDKCVMLCANCHRIEHNTLGNNNVQR